LEEKKKKEESKQPQNYLQVRFFLNLTVTPITKCRLRKLKLERINDYLKLEQEFVQKFEKVHKKKENEDSEEENVLNSL
jgi:26S proteasome regulatory subunit T2